MGLSVCVGVAKLEVNTSNVRKTLCIQCELVGDAGLTETGFSRFEIVGVRFKSTGISDVLLISGLL